jgi:hypothetical protein
VFIVVVYFVISSVRKLLDTPSIFVGKPEGKNHSEDEGVDGKTILELIVGKQGGNVWIEFIWLRIGPVAGCCE